MAFSSKKKKASIASMIWKNGSDAVSSTAIRILFLELIRSSKHKRSRGPAWAQQKQDSSAACRPGIKIRQSYSHKSSNSCKGIAHYLITKQYGKKVGK